jgi:hypothetical protein
MILFSRVGALDPHALLPEGRPHLLPANTAEQRNEIVSFQLEIVSFQLIELHSIPASQGRVGGYRIGKDQSAGIKPIAQGDQLRSGPRGAS